MYCIDVDVLINQKLEEVISLARKNKTAKNKDVLDLTTMKMLVNEVLLLMDKQ